MSVKKVKRLISELHQRGMPAVKVVLAHLHVTYRKEAIWSDTVETTASLDDVSITIYTTAVEHAKGLPGGVQHYTVTAFDPSDDDKTPVASCAFKIESQPATDEEAMGMEPGTSQGLLTQLMRHNQEMHRQTNQAIGTLTYHLARTVEKQQDHIDKLMGDRLGSIEMVEELLSQKHTRDIESKKADAKIKRDAEIWEKVSQMGPFIINKFAGQELVRQKDTVLESVVTSFMNTITPEKLDAIANSGLFDPQQMILFASILEQMTKRMMTAAQKQEQERLAADAALNTLDKDKDKGGGGGEGGAAPAAA